MSEKELQRERIATAALMGLLGAAPVECILQIRKYTLAAVKAADALILELNKEKPVKTGL